MTPITSITYEKFEGTLTLSSPEVTDCTRLTELCFEKRLRFTTEIMLDHLSTSEVYWAKVNNHVIGFVVYLIQPEHQRLRILTLAVDPEHRHAHVGANLIQAVVQEAAKLHPSATVLCSPRPYNEPFYRSQGFVPRSLPKEEQALSNTRAYASNYYIYVSAPPRKSIILPGIFMQRNAQSQAPLESKTQTKTWIKPDQAEHALFRNQLLNLAQQTKSASSCWYGGFMAHAMKRSRRKEQALDAIIRELMALGDEATMNRMLNVQGVLQAIVHNALVIRGFGIFSQKTTSGQALVKMLNGEGFKDLRALIKPGGLEYKDLVEFSGLKPNTRSGDTLAPFSPYRHF